MKTFKEMKRYLLKFMKKHNIPSEEMSPNVVADCLFQAGYDATSEEIVLLSDTL